MCAVSLKRQGRSAPKKSVSKPPNRQPNSKTKAGPTKLSDKVTAISNAVRAIKKSISKLDESITQIECENAQTISDLNQENSKLREEIERCACNVAKLYEAKNASEQHERHSGTRASPSGRLPMKV
jgi:t-SNARE complex subunit (syntaxin)